MDAWMEMYVRMTKCSTSVRKFDHMIHESTSLTGPHRLCFGEKDYLQAPNPTQKQNCHDIRLFFWVKIRRVSKEVRAAQIGNM